MSRNSPIHARRTVRVRAAVVAVAMLATGLLSGPVSGQTQLLMAEDTPRVLIYSATYGFRHAAINEGNTLMMAMGASTGAFAADYSENPSDLSAANLANYDAVVFHSTAGKPPTLDDQTREEFIQFMGCGGGFVGLAMAADSNYAWPEYTELVGGNIVSHPLAEGHEPVRTVVVNPEHPINQTFQDQGIADFSNQEELYSFRIDPLTLPTVKPLLTLDVDTIPSSIQEGPDYYPEVAAVAWTSIFRGRGRSHYNGFGHGDHSWDHQWFREMVLDGIKWVLGPDGHPVDRACAAGSEELPPPNGPTPASPETIGDPCALPPTTGPDRGHYRSTLEVLTAEGTTTTMPVAIPAYIFAPNLRYLLDLSDVKAASATVELVMTFDAPADFDLGVTMPWGFAGSHKTPGVDGVDVNTERVVLSDVPHCTDLLVAAEQFVSLGLLSGDFAPTLTIDVSPNG